MLWYLVGRVALVLNDCMMVCAAVDCYTSGLVALQVLHITVILITTITYTQAKGGNLIVPRPIGDVMITIVP